VSGSQRPERETGVTPLTEEDLDRLTRRELASRVEAESAYWDGRCTEGLSVEEEAAFRRFARIVEAAVDPAAAERSVRRLMAGRDDGFWDEVPGRAALGRVR